MQTVYKETLEAPADLQSTGLSLPWNFAWILAGNVIYALCQGGMIVVLAKLGSPFMVGQFSLGLAISTPVIMLMNLQLRAVQATDVRRGNTFGEYLGLRTITTLIAVAAIFVITRLGTYETKTIMVVLGVSVAKAMEAISDIFYGLFQLNNRLDQTGMSMILKGFVSMLALSAALYFTRDVFWGVIALALAWLAMLLFFDARRGRRFLPSNSALRPQFTFERQWKLARLAFPLGIVMALVSFNLNMPRYFVHASRGETELGIFSTMAYAMVAIVTVVDAMGHSATPKLARLYASGQTAAFRSLLFWLAGLGLLFGAVCTGSVYLAGGKLLTFLYGSEYAVNTSVFVWLTAAAGISTVASLLTNGITSARRFRAQVPMFALVAATNAIACWTLVPRWGLSGAATAAVIAAGVHLLLSTGILAYVLSLQGWEMKATPSQPAYSNSWGSSL